MEQVPDRQLLRGKPMLLLILAGALLFNLLFWQEQLALNLLFFELFLLAALFGVYRGAILSPRVKWLLAAHLISVLMVLLVNTAISKLAAGVTLLLLVAYMEYAHRSAWFAAVAVALNFLFFVGNFFTRLKDRDLPAKKKHGRARLLRLLVFPLLLAALFLLFYQLANTVFADMIQQVTENLSRWLALLSGWLSIDRILFTMLGFYLCGSLLLRTTGRRLELREAMLGDSLQRKNRKPGAPGNRPGARPLKSMLGLKNENTMGIISLLLLNLLLLTVNSIDIHYLWFRFSYSPGPALSRLIHEGTDMLIFSILMAMLVLLFFFRGNLNFYAKNKWLKAGAYAWLVQNAVLVVSVSIRDYYYIKLMGLAYKRIGVAVFLALVLTGLFTVCIKIAFRKTNYYLLRVNAWAALTALVLAGTINWDVLIAKYNLAQSRTIPPDLPFLLSLSDRTLPVLAANFELLRQREDELNRQGGHVGGGEYSLSEILKIRREYYLKTQETYSWLSWNYADANTKRYFAANHGNANAGAK